MPHRFSHYKSFILECQYRQQGGEVYHFSRIPTQCSSPPHPLSSWLKKQPAEKENIVSYKHLTCSQMRCFFYYNLGGHHGQISEEHRGCAAYQRHAVP